MRAAAAFLLLAAACGSAPSRPMSEGERLYRAKCISCHRAYEPGERKDWAAVVDKMLANRKVHLSQEERAEILAFLQGPTSR